MSLFKHHDKGDPAAVEAEAGPAKAPADAVTAAPATIAGGYVRRAFTVPVWMRQFGLASWLILGIVLAIAVVAGLISALTTLLIPMLFAALLGATFMPLADKLERRGVKRWIAALLVMLLIVLIAVAVTAIVVIGVFRQFPTVQQNLSDAAAKASDWLNSHDVKISVDQIKSSVKQASPDVVKGVAGALVNGVSAIAGLIFGIFIGLNILVWFLMQGAWLGLWASKHMSPIPQPVAYRLLANAARFLRGYIWGSTIIGLFNGAVMFLGALALGVPLAATIGIVGWFTNYVPMFGAIIGGAFAVLIALGSGGWTTGLAMLVIVIIANGALQTVVSQFALGAALKLHPLAVLFATTAGGILFGAIGGIVAAPFLKIFLDASKQLKDTGLFSGDARVPAGGFGVDSPELPSLPADGDARADAGPPPSAQPEGAPAG